MNFLVNFFKIMNPKFRFSNDVSKIIIFALFPIATFSFLTSSSHFAKHHITQASYSNHGSQWIYCAHVSSLRSKYCNKVFFSSNQNKKKEKQHFLSTNQHRRIREPLYASQQIQHQTIDHNNENMSVEIKISDTKLGKEFYSMMSEFVAFTSRDIENISNPRFRAMYYGVKAGGLEPNVYRAFEILYEDMIPIRLAGRMIFSRLKDSMKKSIERRKQEELNIVKATGLDLEDIDDGRRAFKAIKTNYTESKDDFLTLDQLVESGIIHTIVELSTDSNLEQTLTFDEFIDQLKVDKKGRLSFENFMIGLQQCATIDSEKPASCKITTVLQEVEERMGPIEAAKREETDENRKKKYSEQFDKMVDTFKLWEVRDIAVGSAKKDSRMSLVLEGCFDGAKNRDVVNALKIVYVDYSALRVAGNLVFKLVSKLVG